MDIKTLGIDLAKNIFQLHAVNAAGRLELKKTIKRAHFLSNPLHLNCWPKWTFFC